MATQENSNESSVTSISDLIGVWGPLQRKFFICLVIVYFIAPFNYSALYFYGINDDIWCQSANGTQQTIIHPNKCRLSELNSCETWGFSSDRVTVSKEWNLICEYYWLRSMVLTINVLGYFVSGIITGGLADRYGRKYLLKISVMLEIVIQMFLIFTKNLYFFMFLRFLHGFVGCGRYSCVLILRMETVGAAIRGRTVVFFDFLWFLSFYITLIIAYFVLDFRGIFLFGMIYQVFSLIPLNLIPESPRWQLVMGHRSQAKLLLKAYSSFDEDTFNTKFNKLCETFDEEKKRELSEKVNIWSLFKNRKTLNIFICLWILWAFRSFLQDGLDYITFDLPGSVFLNQAIFATAGCVGNIFIMFIVDKYERRNMLAIALLVSSTMVPLCIPFVGSNSSKSMMMIIFLFLAHGFVSCGLAICTCYTPEIFPTQIRSFCLGSCFAADKIAASTSSFINQITASVNLQFSLIVLAVPGDIAASTLSLLPRTKGREMADTIGQMIDEHEDVHQLEQLLPAQ